ncbi:MAG: DNA repair protein RecN, partial [Oscillospiraceae bacterium]
KKGLNIFTGETGAGKTILISAINAILGQRVSKDIIRTGESTGFISALFEDINDNALEKLTEMGYAQDDENSVLIAREISTETKGSCKINGRPATLQILREFAGVLSFLDSYCDLEERLSEYKELFAATVKVKRDLEKLKQDDLDKNIKIDMLKYQIKEIEEANLVIGELEELKSQRKIIRNSEKITTSLGESKEIIDGNNEQLGVLDLLSHLSKNMSDVSNYIDDFESYGQKLDDMYYEIQEIGEDIKERLSEIDYDVYELNSIENRIDTITSLTHKYGQDEEEILAHLEKCKDELEGMEFSEEKAERLSGQLEELLQRLQHMAEQISDIRLAGAEDFIKKLENELSFLNMPNVKLMVKHEITKLRSGGFDDIEFLISTNVGETPKPLAKIASGGELSRIMLSIKNVFAQKDNIDTSIFDEIDTGISGLAAQKVGEKLKALSKARQIICVTHLAQVAMFADNHLLIKKNVANERTFTTINVIVGETRVHEIARITSGDLITEASIENARELIAYGER